MTLPLKQGKEWSEKREALPAMSAVETKYSMAERASDFHYFNHGALFTFTELDPVTEDPIMDWYAQQPLGTVIFREMFRKPVFNGLKAKVPLASRSWDYCLCGVPHEVWDSLWQFLGGVALLDDVKKQYSQVFTGDVRILDPVMIERYGPLNPLVPAITVTVFCVETNKDRWEVRPPMNVVTPPTFERVDPRPEVVALGEAVLAGDVSKLQHKDNPAFQPLLDRYEALRNARGTNASIN